MREIRMSGVTRGEVIGGGRPSPTLLYSVVKLYLLFKYSCLLVFIIG